MDYEKTDILIIGGGVAGLSCAIGLKNESNLKIVLLEKYNEFGSKIKGEIVNQKSEIFKKIFNNKFPVNIRNVIFKTAKYYTPTTKKFAIRKFPFDTKIGIEYRKLIDELVKVLTQSDVDIRINSEVIELIEKNDKFIGVKYKDTNGIKEIYSKIIVCAAGIDFLSLCNRFTTPPKNICPAIKLNAENVDIPDQSQLEFFLLEIPSIIYLFPKSKTKAEIGIILWNDQVKNNEKFNLHEILMEQINSHQILKKRLANAKFIYYSKEKLPLGGPLKNLYFPNIFFIGDMAGHVGAIGGSGIVSSMSIGYYLGVYLKDLFNIKKDFTDNDFIKCQKLINKLNITKWLKKEASNAKVMRNILYSTYPNKNFIDDIWDKFKYFIESRGP